MDVDLVVVEGRPLGAVVPVKVSPFVIGRDPGCQLRPKSPTASGRHSAIFLRDDQVVVGDLGSTNGTLVNDHCLHAGEEVPVVDGDRLQVGQLIFVVRIVPEVPGVESSLQGWLTPPEREPDGDRNSRTLLLSALSQGGPSANHSSGLRPAAPGGAPLKFLDREFDQFHRVLCVGLSRVRLNEEGVGELRRALFALAANPDHRRAVLDLADVDSLPVAAYPLLLTLAGRWREAGGELRLCSLSADVRRMVIALGLDRIIGHYGDRPGAVSEPWGCRDAGG